MQLRRSPRLAAKATLLPTDAKTTLLPTDAKTTLLPTDANTTLLPTDANTTLLPTDAKAGIATVKPQPSVIIVTKENKNKYNLRVGDTITIHSETNSDTAITGNVTVTGTDGFIYKGQMLNGWFHGKGASTYKNGTRYCGEFVNGEYHGKGKMTYNDGIYEGEFANGVRHGKGKITYTNGQAYYEGEFSNGTRHGRGITTYLMDEPTVGNAPLETRCPTYIGDYVNNLEHGKGVYDWGTHRERYTGEFSNGDFHGNGELLKDNGMDQTGRFKNGSFVGK